MGLYDREYIREEARQPLFGGGRSMVVNLILVNVGLFVADALAGGKISQLLSLKANLPREPWNAWQLLTAGFVHDHNLTLHLVFNMLGLWIFGREVESLRGRAEFLRVYLVTIVVASLAWVISTNMVGGFDPNGRVPTMLGASGGVSGLLAIFVMFNPMRTLLFFGVLPMPAWLLGLLFFLGDLMGMQRSVIDESVGTAYAAHLGGAAFGLAYQYFHWNFGRFIGGDWKWPKRRPKLRVYAQDNEPDRPRVDLSARVDEILEKISRSGESSLSRDERQLLEEASRKYQQRRR